MNKSMIKTETEINSALLTVSTAAEGASDRTSIAALPSGGFVSVSNYYDEWNELGNDTAYVLLDGEQWNVHEFMMDTDVGSDVKESYTFLYSDTDFKKLLNSKEFKFKVGNYIAIIDLTKLPLTKFSFED